MRNSKPYLAAFATAASIYCAGASVSGNEQSANPEAESASDEAQGEKTEGEDVFLGLNIDLGFSTAYVFRGLNVFQSDSSMDPHMLLAPGITWTIFDTGLSLVYWAAYQLNGKNVSSNIDEGIGAEQDLILIYELEVNEFLGVSAGLAYYFFPFADKTAAGASVPGYLEPAVGLRFTLFVDFGLTVSYFAGIQEVLDDYSYFYVNPTIGKSFELHERVGLDTLVSYGYKTFRERTTARNNIHDITITAGLPIQLSDIFYVRPSIGFAWTNIEPTTGADKNALLEESSTDVGEKNPLEIVVFGGLNMGADF